MQCKYVPCNIEDMYLLNSYSLLILNSNLKGHPVILFAESGNSAVTRFVLNKCDTVLEQKLLSIYMRRLRIIKF